MKDKCTRYQALLIKRSYQREALDLEWPQTIVTVILGFLAQFLITTFITGLVLGVFELGAPAIG